ncbi:AraC family transcriptional regulator [Paenibacillus sacheonensis]|nr:AraC family transcriptional regulator [Paenibacillus sacheonensis]
MKELMPLTIESLLNRLQKNYGSNLLHILNGQAMYERIHAWSLTDRGSFVPFNEAMCSHAATETIFSDAFNALRAAGHGVTPEEYARITLVPLQPLFETSHDCIALWFGDDMFCQINLLTLLAYLRQRSYTGRIVFLMIKESTTTGDIAETELPDLDYEDLYRKTLIQREAVEVPQFPVLSEGIKRYLTYRAQDNEITAYIRAHQNLPQNELLQRLFREFAHYGLGDTQYLSLIRAMET